MPIARDIAGRGIQALRLRPGGTWKRAAGAESARIGPFADDGGDPAVQVARALMIHVEGGAIFCATGDDGVTAALPDGGGDGGGHRISAAHGVQVVSLQGVGGPEALDTHFAFIAEEGTPLVFVTELH